jgi:hypothetical protein
VPDQIDRLDAAAWRHSGRMAGGRWRPTDSGGEVGNGYRGGALCDPRLAGLLSTQMAAVGLDLRDADRHRRRVGRRDLPRFHTSLRTGG